MQVVLYGESLCPSCKFFVENIVAPMFDEGLNKDLFRFRYFAYGNARNQSNVGAHSLGPGKRAALGILLPLQAVVDTTSSISSG